MVLVPPVVALESRMACRREPGPLSAVVVTTKMPSVIETWAWIGLAPSDPASRLKDVSPWKSGGGANVNRASAASSAEQRAAVR